MGIAALNTSSGPYEELIRWPVAAAGTKPENHQYTQGISRLVRTQ